jgi:hypothetical protein
MVKASGECSPSGMVARTPRTATMISTGLRRPLCTALARELSPVRTRLYDSGRGVRRNGGLARGVVAGVALPCHCVIGAVHVAVRRVRPGGLITAAGRHMTEEQKAPDPGEDAAYLDHPGRVGAAAGVTLCPRDLLALQVPFGCPPRPVQLPARARGVRAGRRGARQRARPLSPPAAPRRSAWSPGTSPSRRSAASTGPSSPAGQGRAPRRRRRPPPSGGGPGP